MAQNLNNVQYVFMQNAGLLQAPPGQTYQLPPSSLIGPIGMRRRNPDGRLISIHKTNLGLANDAVGEALYTA